MKFTVITSRKPKTLSKEYFINSEGEVDRRTVANLSDGTATLAEVETLHEFSKLLLGLERNQALCYGVTRQSPVNVLSKDAFTKKGSPSDAITRTKEHFHWPNSPGIFYLDYDPVKNESPLSKDSLIEKLLSVMPSLHESGYIWWCSSSSNIFNTATDEIVNGLKGQRIYIPVKEASDIPRAGKVLVERLWLAGFGHIEIGVAGQKLERCLVDSSVWQTNRLDFAAGAQCKPPLEQRRGNPVVHEGPHLDSKEALPDLSDDEALEVKRLKMAVKRKVEQEANEVEQLYIEKRSIELAGVHANEEQINDAEKIIRRALSNDILTGDFQVVLSDGQVLTVGQLLDDPKKYHQALTFDPIEPEYDGGKIVGKLFLIGGRPNLHSFAHGGRTFKLIRQPRRIELVAGRTHDAVIDTLALMRELPDIFDYGDTLVSVENGKLTPFNEHLLIHWLGGIVQYWQRKKNKNGDFYEVLLDPNPKVVRPLLNMRRDLNPLDAVITAPTITPNGRLVDKPGYHSESRLYLDTREVLPSIPEMPTLQEVKNAVDVLFKPFTDFPFAGVLDKSVFMSALLSACLRPVLPTCPAFGFDAPVQGSGKTLLAQCIAALSTGEAPTVWPHTAGRDDEEIRKRLLTALKSGERAIVWDNVLGAFDSAAMAALLTSSKFTDRILGQSQEITIPNKALMLLTGNNLCLAGDMPRRVLLSRIDPESDSPHKRRFDLCPLSYTLENRQYMVTAALTIVKGWLDSDEMLLGEEADGRMASFEVWDEMVRQPVAWLARTVFPGKFEDVMKAVDDAQQSDPEQEALYELLSAIHQKHGSDKFAAKELIDSVGGFSDEFERITQALEDIAPGKKIGNAKSVGRILLNRRGRLVKGLKLEATRAKDNWLYQVKNLIPDAESQGDTKVVMLQEERLAAHSAGPPAA